MNKAPIVARRTRGEINKTDFRFTTLIRVAFEILSNALLGTSGARRKILPQTNLKLPAVFPSTFLQFHQRLAALERLVETKVVPTFERHLVGEIRRDVEDLKVRMS